MPGSGKAGDTRSWRAGGNWDSHPGGSWDGHNWVNSYSLKEAFRLPCKQGGPGILEAL